MFNIFYDRLEEKHFVVEDGIYGVDNIPKSHICFIQGGFETREEAKGYLKLYDGIAAITKVVYDRYSLPEKAVLLTTFETTKSKIDNLRFLGFSKDYELLVEHFDTCFYKLTDDELLVVDPIYKKAYIMMV